MNPKNLIRTFVILGILAWPTVETYRFWRTTQKLAEAQALEQTVTAKLENARARNAQVARADTGSNPGKQ
jgi:hypothetical protein